MTTPEPKRIAVIPARGGSKRLPRKNIRAFCGKPMIGHILGVAQESNLFDIIHVSTEDDEIRDTCATLGFAPDFSRDIALSDDSTPIMPVLRFVLDAYRKRGHTFDEVWLLMACAPMIETEDLVGAAALYAANKKAKPVLAVAPFPVPIEWAFDLDSSGKLTELQPDMFAVRSQDLAKRYFDTGTFAVFPSDYVENSTGAGNLAGFLGYEIPRYKAIDIDDWDDWDMAERMFLGSGRGTSKRAKT